MTKPRPTSADPALAAALAALQRQDHGTARDALVTAWQARRSPVLAELIDVLDLRAPDALTAQLAAIIRPRVVTTHVAFAKVAELDDPRVATFALHALAQLPFTTPTARDFLEDLIGTVERLADSRLVGRADAIRAAVRTRINPLAIRTRIVARVDGTIARLPVLAEPNPEERALETAIAAQLEPLRKSTRSAESLLADIYAHPEDDGPRLVYADLLLERGDPRGELITLQLARSRDPAAPPPTQREVDLLKKHGRTWLGALVPALSWGRGYSTTEFRRGFVAAADIIQSVHKKLEPIRADPAWNTVEQLDGEWPNDLLATAPLNGLQVIDRSMAGGTLAELAARRPTPLAAVTILRLSDLTIDPVTLQRMFPALRTVRMHREVPGATELAILATFGVQRVEITHNVVGAMALTEAQDEFSAQVSAVIGSPAPIAELSLSIPYTRYADAGDTLTLRRGADGRFELV
ncbi:MAG: TIGR02996 domain-containing protein [Deltaproteobacteria bacterium]|nr:TIGR02996 domain-containing protein [Deltaproteobacteria bacterium]